MNDVFDSPSGEPKGEPNPDAPATDAPAGEGAAPPAATETPHVPLAALEAERGQRRDWKEKALRLEGEIKAMREQGQRQEPRERDPLRDAVEAAQNERLDTSEMLSREKFGDKAVDEAYEKFAAAVQKDPTLYQKVMSQKHPWGAMVKEMQRQALLDEIGDDPAAYRERIKAELTAGAPPPPAPRAPLPTSLAGSRSSASRTADAFTGPPDMKQLFG